MFIGNEDIRHQLAEVTKSFDKIHNQFKKIMDTTNKNSNIYYNCVQNESRKAELTTLLHKLEQTQKKLNDYLGGKSKTFPRFYFISTPDLLDILGSPDPEDIQRHLDKLFYAKRLVFGKGKVIKGMVDRKGESF